ncbi:MAG: N-acyl homoserine lactonase family protein [Solirubrobacterales bacterium]
MRVHVIQTGTLTANKTLMRGKGWSSLLRRPVGYEFPAYSFIVEHPEGHIAIDAGLTAAVRIPRPLGRIVPRPSIRPEEEIGPRMREMGLRVEDVRRVIVTHLDWDHVGGIGHFPNAEVLIHRPEYEFASTLRGKLRYMPKLWPSRFEPTLYDLDPDPHGPFPVSKTVTESGDIRLVPIPGHTIGQIGAILQTDEVVVFFAADHVLRQDWFLEEYEAGRLVGLGGFFPKLAVETSRRVHRFLEQVPTVFLPSHDAETPVRLAAMEPLKV